VSAEEFYKSINAFNKDLIDKTSRRFFFVHDYEKIHIEGAPSKESSLKSHPDVDFGKRIIKSNQEFLIQKDDLKEMTDNNLYRLMDCLNFTKKEGKYVFDSIEHEAYKSRGKKIVHWLPAGDCVDVEVLMPDARLIKGKGESNLVSLKVGDIIQFERFGFCRLDSIEHVGKNVVYKFWFAHK
jgi:glutamyl-tRNA synthetase